MKKIIIFGITFILFFFISSSVVIGVDYIYKQNINERIENIGITCLVKNICNEFQKNIFKIQRLDYSSGDGNVNINYIQKINFNGNNTYENSYVKKIKSYTKTNTGLVEFNKSGNYKIEYSSNNNSFVWNYSIKCNDEEDDHNSTNNGANSDDEEDSDDDENNNYNTNENNLEININFTDIDTNDNNTNNCTNNDNCTNINNTYNDFNSTTNITNDNNYFDFNESLNTNNSSDYNDSNENFCDDINNDINNETLDNNNTNDNGNCINNNNSSNSNNSINDEMNPSLNDTNIINENNSIYDEHNCKKFEIKTNKILFNVGEKIYIDFLNLPEMYNITYWIEDAWGNIVKNKYKTDNNNTKTYTIKNNDQLESGYVIFAEVISNEGNFNFKKLVLGKNKIEESGDKSVIAFDDTEYNKKTLSIKYSLSIERLNTKKRTVDIILEDNDENIIGVKEKMSIYKDGKIIVNSYIPISDLDFDNDECIYIIAKGFDTEDRKKICIINDIELDEKINISIYTRKKYLDANTTFYVNFDKVCDGILIVENGIDYKIIDLSKSYGKTQSINLRTFQGNQEITATLVQNGKRVIKKENIFLIDLNIIKELNISDNSSSERKLIINNKNDTTYDKNSQTLSDFDINTLMNESLDNKITGYVVENSTKGKYIKIQTGIFVVCIVILIILLIKKLKLFR